MTLPTGLPYYLRRELGSVQPSEYVDFLLSEKTLQSVDKDVIKSRIERFVTFFIKASEDHKWLEDHPELKDRLLARAIFIFNADQKYKKRFQGILAQYSPNFKLPQNSSVANDLTMSIKGHEVKGSSKLLVLQSEFFQKLLLNGASFRENQAFQAGETVEIEREYPELVAALIGSLDTFTLDIPEQTTIEEIEYLIHLSKEWMVESSSFPLLEEELMQRIDAENASYLYFLASEMKMQQLSEKCLGVIYANLDDESCVEILETLESDPAFGSMADNQTLIDCCLNYMISRLPSKLEADESAEFCDKFAHYASYLTKLDDGSLHLLAEKNLLWVLSKCSDNLEALNLSQCAFKNLVALDKFSKLKTLFLRDCHQLLRIDTLKQVKDTLQFLDLTRCSALKNIAVVAHLEKLDHFYFSGCSALSDTAIKAIERFPNLENLRIESDSEAVSLLLENIAASQGWVMDVK